LIRTLYVPSFVFSATTSAPPKPSTRISSYTLLRVRLNLLPSAMNRSASVAALALSSSICGVRGKALGSLRMRCSTPHIVATLRLTKLLVISGCPRRFMTAFCEAVHWLSSKLSW
jgi:hypothetical protein